MSADFAPMEVLKSAVMANSNQIILAHNHPSGYCEPSYNDIAATMDLVKMARPIGINIMDHIIVGSGSYISLKSAGYMKDVK